MFIQSVPTFFLTSVGQRRIAGALSSFDARRKLSVQSFQSAGSVPVPPSATESCHGYLSLWSPDHILSARYICFRLFTQAILLAFAFAEASAGNRSPARIAMIAITTNNSISVNPSLLFF